MRLLLLSMLVACLYFKDVIAQTTDQRSCIEAGYGTVTVGSLHWQRFSLRPDIPIGNFGIGFDIEMFIDEKGIVSEKGWGFSNSKMTWDTLA